MRRKSKDLIIKIKWLENITIKERRQALKSCNEVGENLFTDYDLLPIDEKKKYRTFFLYKYDMFIGWSIVDLAGHYFGKHYRKADIYINIRPHHRRKKYGTYLLNYSSRYCSKINKKPHAHPYDKVGYEFYLSNKKNCNLKLLESNYIEFFNKEGIT